MVFDETEKELTNEDVTTFECSLSINLPDNFKNHYLQSNGGYPPFDHVRGIENIFTIDGFLPIKYGALTIERIIEDYKKSGITFVEQIPFANDTGGNIFVLSVRESDYGAVYIRESEYIDDESHMWLVQNSFTDFLNSFYNEE